jgi:glutamate dehydrogenase
VKGSELEAELIDEVVARIRERLPSDQVDGCEAFARHYFQWVPPEDLADRDAIDLYGAVVAHWNLAQHRAPGEAKLHVYNPDFEQHGWQSSNTVVELVTEDMPFLVDSVTMEVARQGYGTQLVIHPVIEEGGPREPRWRRRRRRRQRRRRRRGERSGRVGDARRARSRA